MNKRSQINDMGDGTSQVVLANGRGVAIVDTVDVPIVAPYSWHLKPQHRGLTRYAEARAVTGDGKVRMVAMHRLLLLGCDEIDHISGDSLDNRLANLRSVTRSQNQCNARVQARNKTGIKGVRWMKSSRKFVAFIRVNKVLKYLGLFERVEDAAEARRVAEVLYHGEFARKK